MKLDCRDKLTLENGSICVFMSPRASLDNLRLRMFDMYDSAGALMLKCRIMGKQLAVSPGSW